MKYIVVTLVVFLALFLKPSQDTLVDSIKIKIDTTLVKNVPLDSLLKEQIKSLDSLIVRKKEPLKK